MLIGARVVQGAGGAMASGLLNTTVQVGGAVGLAVLATLSSEETAGRLADGEAPRPR